MTVDIWLKQVDKYFENGLVSFLITSVLLIVFAFIVKELAHYTVKLLQKRQTLSENMSKFVSHILMALLYVVTTMSVLMQIVPFHNYTVSILAGSGIAVLVVGFAAQETFSNIIAGIFISIFKPFTIGDTVTLTEQGITGIVEDINLRHTTIRTYQNNRMMIPNSTMNSSIVENKNFNDCSIYNYVYMFIRYGSDTELALKILHEVAMNEPLCIKKEKISTIVYDLTLSGAQLRLAFWATDLDNGFTASTLMRGEILTKFKDSGIEFSTIRVTQ